MSNFETISDSDMGNIIGGAGMFERAGETVGRYAGGVVGRVVPAWKESAPRIGAQVGGAAGRVLDGVSPIPSRDP